jgi:hypothetical protein
MLLLRTSCITTAPRLLWLRISVGPVQQSSIFETTAILRCLHPEPYRLRMYYCGKCRDSRCLCHVLASPYVTSRRPARLLVPQIGAGIYADHRKRYAGVATYILA